MSRAMSIEVAAKTLGTRLADGPCGDHVYELEVERWIPGIAPGATLSVMLAPGRPIVRSERLPDRIDLDALRAWLAQGRDQCAAGDLEKAVGWGNPARCTLPEFDAAQRLLEARACGWDLGPRSASSTGGDWFKETR